MSQLESQKKQVFGSSDRRFLIQGAVGEIEVVTREGSPNASAESSDAALVGAISKEPWLVVICHPHPQHGGSMDNKVVTTVARAAREAGISSLRFNYRGVGKSGGVYGDFEGECEDLDAVMQWIAQSTNKTQVLLAGFSFGSAVAANRSSRIQGLKHLLLLAPPVESYSYPDNFVVPVTIIQGSADEVLDAKDVTRWMESIKTPYEYWYLGHCSHFFHGRLVELRRRLVPLFQSVLTVAKPVLDTAGG